MMVDKDNKRLSLFNRCGATEFRQIGNRKEYNRDYWECHKEMKYYRGGDRATFKTIDIGMHIPQYCIRQQDRQQAKANMDVLLHKGPAINIEVCFLTLKQQYAQVFLSNMRTDLMASARLGSSPNT